MAESDKKPQLDVSFLYIWPNNIHDLTIIKIGYGDIHSV